MGGGVWGKNIPPEVIIIKTQKMKGHAAAIFWCLHSGCSSYRWVATVIINTRGEVASGDAAAAGGTAAGAGVVAGAPCL